MFSQVGSSLAEGRGMHMVHVSVVVPVYGVEDYIEETIQSVLHQTYSDFELLVIDDESPDRSVELCRAFQDSRIKIISQNNRGLAGARNTGIRHAKGQYIAFLDGDDCWRPDKLKRHVEHLDSSPHVGVSFSRSEFMDHRGQPLGTYLMPKLTEIELADLFRSNPVGNGSAPVVRRAVFDNICNQVNREGETESVYFDENFRRSEDIECWLRILIQTDWKMEGISEPLTLYRINAQGLSASLMNQFESWKQVLEKVASYAPDVAERWSDSSKAYRLRFLARNALRMRDRPLAIRLIHQSLATYPRIMVEETARTLRILAGAYLLRLLPESAYLQLEAVASKMASSIQQRQASIGQPSTES